MWWLETGAVILLLAIFMLVCDSLAFQQGGGVVDYTTTYDLSEYESEEDYHYEDGDDFSDIFEEVDDD